VECSLQVTCAEIVIISVVAFLFVALFRIRHLSRIKFALKCLLVTLTFEAEAGSKQGDLPPGQEEPMDIAPVRKAKRRAHPLRESPPTAGPRLGVQAHRDRSR
jgi:hypothetical protein